MKKILICSLLLFSFAVFAQTPTLSIGTVEAGVGQTVNVPINANNLSDVGSISLKIAYSNTALTFSGVANAVVPLTSNASGGVISLGWFDATASNPLNLPSGKLADLVFTVNGASNLNFITAQCELSNSAGDPISPVIYNNGAVVLQQTKLTISNVNAAIGTNIAVPVKVDNFSNVGSISLKINYNQNNLTFSNVTSSALTGFTFNAVSGVVTFSWFDVNPISLANGTTLFNLNFSYIGGTNPLTFNVPQCQITDSLGNPIIVTYVNGSVNPLPGSAPTLSLANALALPGNSVVVPLRARNFSNVGSFSIKINYNPASTVFNSISGNFNNIPISVNASGGVITLGWFDQSGNNPINLPDNILTNLNFTYQGGTSNLVFNQTLTEVSDALGNPIVGIEFQNGSVSLLPIPPVPVLVSPVNNAINQAIDQTFRWNPSSNAASYRFQLSTDNGFNTIVSDLVTSDTSVSVNGLLNSTQYYWRVNATNAAGTSSYSAPFTFTTIIATPVAPTLVSPANNAVNQPYEINFVWNAVTGAATYRLQIATDTNFVNVIFNDSTLTVPNKVVSGLQPFTNYYWRVNAKNVGGTSPFSQRFTFRTISVTPTLVSPANGATNQPISLNLSWTASPNVTTYRVQLATDVGFSNIVLDDAAVSGTTRALTGLSNNQTYFWRVSAGGGNFSSPWSFTTIVAVPLAPTLLTPANNSTGLSTTGLVATWSPVAGAATYRFQAATDAGFTNIIINDSTLTTTNYNLPALSGYTNYYWRVNAKNIAGTSPFSSVFTFRTKAGTPTLTSPANNSVNQPVSLTLSWSAVPNVPNYRVQVATDLAFNNLVVNDSTVTGTSRAVSGLSNSQTYYWRVRAADGDFSEVWSFTTIIAVPVAPTLLSPANNAVNQNTDLTLSWNPVPGAETYRVQLATDASFNNLVLNDSTVTATSRSVTGLQGNIVYYWRVNAKNLAGTGPFSSVFNFKTKAGIATLLSPPNGAINQPTSLTLSWTAIPNVSTYRVQVATDAAFTTLVVNDSTVTTTSRNLTGLQNATQYYWRVSALGGDFSNVFTFTTIVALPAAPTLVSPANGAFGQPFEVTLTWNPVAGASTYRVQVATDEAFANIILDDSTVVNPNMVISGLESFTRYYWRVRAKNFAGNGNYSATFNFLTKLGIATLISPTNGALTTITFDLIWSKVKGATLYIVQISKDSLFATVDLEDQLTDTVRTTTGLTLNTKYYWRVRARNSTTPGTFSAPFSFTPVVVGVSGEVSAIPDEYNLYQNFPNPFNPTTRINYDLPEEGNVSLIIYDMLGNEVRTLVSENQPAGRYSVKFDATGLGSGIYFYRLVTDKYTLTKKLLLLK